MHYSLLLLDNTVPALRHHYAKHHGKSYDINIMTNKHTDVTAYKY